MKKKSKQIHFAFLLHPRNTDDIIRKYPFTKILPEFVLIKIFNYLPSMVVSSIEGLKDEKGEERRGIVLSIPLLPKQMLQDKNNAKKIVIKAIKKARSLGARHVGLGAFTSVVTSGGLDVKNKIPGIHITNGNAFTAYISYLGLNKLIKKHPEKKPTISIVGATGSIGSVITELLIEEGNFKKLYIIGKTPSRIKELLQRFSSSTHYSKVFDRSLEDALPESDIILIATSADGAVVNVNNLKRGAFVYDITQPKNISSELLADSNIEVFEGGIVKLPKGVKVSNYIGTAKSEVFACLAETLLLSLLAYPDDFCLGKVTKEQVTFIGKVANQYNFRQAKIKRML